MIPFPKGPSGCGKTFFGEAISNELDIAFIKIKGPEILNKYIGASEQAVRDLFEKAQKEGPSIIFFDEFDSIAIKRNSGSTSVCDRIVNQLLSYLDGIHAYDKVFILCASSRPDLIDPALLRPVKNNNKIKKHREE